MKRETTILIVDDEQSYLDTISETLKDKEYNILQALDGQMGYRVAKKFLPDVIIMDWDMPILNGIESIRLIKGNNETKHIPIIVSTGVMTEVSHLETALNAGAVDFLRKPIEPLELLARLHAILKLAKAYQNIEQQRSNLAELNNTKDKFFSIIAHDLRGPMGTMTSTLDMLLQRKKFDERSNKLLASLQKASHTTYKLLQNLLTWAEMQRGEITFFPQEHKIKHVFESSYKLLSNSAKEKNININIQNDEELSAEFDFNMVCTIVRNLTSNAIKFSHPNSEIKITTKKEKDKMQITIKDNGIGMEPEETIKLFKIESKQASRTGTSGEKGSGLGLILCKEFIDKHHGTISVKSKPEEGSTFRFEIPLKQNK